MSSASRARHHATSEYGSCDPSPNTRRIYSCELDDSDIDTWNSEHIIRELKAEIRRTNDRKSYYKDLYRRERQDRLRDRELRDLVEKKLMDDLRSKEIECANHILHIKALEEELERQATYRSSIRDSGFRIPHFCTPSTSTNTTSTMAGAGEALSSTSELFAIRTAAAAASSSFMMMGGGAAEMPDETKVFRQPDELSLELPRNGIGNSGGGIGADISSTTARSVLMQQQQQQHQCNRQHDGTVLEEDKQSDNGYGTTSECASEIRTIRRAHSDSHILY